MNEKIGEKIKRLRDEMDLKQVSIHHNQAQVSLIEKGKISNPDETTLRIIAKGLDTTLDNLIEGTDWVKPEDRSLGKEIAVSPNDIDIEVDDSGIVDWSFKTYPLYNDKGERNEYCPVSGEKLIYQCDKCERQIENSSQMFCLGCGEKIFTEYVLGYNYNDIVTPDSWLYHDACMSAIYELEHRRDDLKESLVNKKMVKSEKKWAINEAGLKDKKSFTDKQKFMIDTMMNELERQKWFHIKLFEETIMKLRKVSAKLHNERGEVSMDDKFKQVNLELYDSLMKKVNNILEIRSRHMLKNPESRVGHKIFKDIVELMKMSQSDDQNDQMISKLENMVNEEEKNKNSEDGNSETTAAETAESEIENAEKKKNKGGEE